MGSGILLGFLNLGLCLLDPPRGLGSVQRQRCSTRIPSHKQPSPCSSGFSWNRRPPQPQCKNNTPSSPECSLCLTLQRQILNGIQLLQISPRSMQSRIGFTNWGQTKSWDPNGPSIHIGCLWLKVDRAQIPSADVAQGSLSFAFLFLLLNCACLTASPAARPNSRAPAL